jgi:hypothetical protein
MAAPAAIKASRKSPVHFKSFSILLLPVAAYITSLPRKTPPTLSDVTIITTSPGLAFFSFVCDAGLQSPAPIQPSGMGSVASACP